MLAIAGGVITIAGFFLLKETYHPVLLERRAAALRKSTGDPAYRSRMKQSGTNKDIFVRAIVRPMKILFLSPICMLFTIYTAVTCKIFLVGCCSGCTDVCIGDILLPLSAFHNHLGGIYQRLSLETRSCWTQLSRHRGRDVWRIARFSAHVKPHPEAT